MSKSLYYPYHKKNKVRTKRGQDNVSSLISFGILKQDLPFWILIRTENVALGGLIREESRATGNIYARSDTDTLEFFFFFRLLFWVNVVNFFSNETELEALWKCMQI